VERELRRYLECGILAYGFARARCPECGHDFLVAFTCKGRGVCPSCNARRMAETAAHLVDHVFPPLPVRQWVLSVPKRLRWYLEREPKAVTIVYRLPKPQRDGRAALSLTPLELIDHLVALIPPPRLHRHRYHGVLAPNAPLRPAATAYGRDADPGLTHPPPVAGAPPASSPTAAAPSGRSPAHYLWAMLVARLFLA
jgi:hypothetical protein